MFCCRLRFFFLNSHKVGLFFSLVDWWSSEFHTDCISYLLLVFLNPVTKNQSRNERGFCQRCNYHIHTMCVYPGCYFLSGECVCVCVFNMYTSAIFVQRLKLDLGQEMGLGMGLFLFPQHSKWFILFTVLISLLSICSRTACVCVDISQLH